MQPKISIIIPVYNKAERLEICMQSIIGQYDNEIELIVVEDCSTDNSKEILRRYERQYSFIKLIENNKNCGVSYSRNVGLDHASGKYVWFIDADDWIENDAIKILIEQAEIDNVDVLFFDAKRVVGSNYYFCEYIEDSKNSVINRVVDGRTLFTEIYKTGFMWEAVWRQIVQRKVYQEFGMRFIEGIISEDSIFAFELFLKASKVKYIKRYLYNYYQYENSITYKSGTVKKFVGGFTGWCEMIRLFNSLSFQKEVKDCICDYIGDYYRIVRNSFQEERREEIIAEINENRPEIYYIFNILFREDKELKKLQEIKQIIWEKISEYNQIIIYGAGKTARRVAEYIDELEKEIIAYAISDSYEVDKSNPKNIYGVPVKKIGELLQYKDEVLIIIATLAKHHKDIQRDLEKYGFTKFIFVE